MNGTNKRKARDAGYRARYEDKARRGNPFPNDAAWGCLCGSWYDGWDTANKELKS